MRHLPSQKWLFATSALIGFSIVQPSFAAEITITTGTTVGQQSVGDGDTLIIETSATINNAAAAVVDTVDGSTVDIKNDGTITSSADAAIDNTDSTLNLANNGSISGFNNGIDTLNIGMLTNTGDIVGQLDGIYAIGDTKSFINSGSITGVAFSGLLGDGTLSYLSNTGLITGGSDGVAYRVVSLAENSGTISGDFTGLLSDEIGSVFNTGLITSSFGIGVEGLSSIGSVNNTGMISGDLVGIQSGGVFGSFTNSGLVTSVNGAGVLSLGRLGMVDNSGTVSGLIFGIGAEDIGSIFNSGLITGEDGVYSNTNLTGLTNNGTISGSFFSGVSVQNTVGTITNNGAITGLDNGVDVGDLNSLVNTGSITGTDTDGVLVGGTLGSLSNYGSITGGVHAVDSRYITMLNNTGSLLGGEDGIFAQTITSLTNSGSITATTNDGILAENLINLTNTGSITGADDGVDVEYITNLTNYGSITGQDEGIKSRIITMLTNNGTITGGTASDSSGIDADFGTVVNNGLIQGGIGIEFDRTNSSGTNPGNASVTNNGTIRSLSGASGIAIDFQGVGSDTLSLTQNSLIIGLVSWDGVNDTLNLPDHTNFATTFSIVPQNINASSPFVVISGNTVVQADASFLASTDDVISETSGNVGQAIFDRTSSALFTNSQDEGSQSYDSVSNAGTRNIWTTVWAGYKQLETTQNLDTDETYSVGNLFGIDWVGQSGTLYGAYAGLGVGYTKIGRNPGQTIKSNAYYGGVYSQFTRGDIDVHVNLLGGYLGFDSQRSVINNLATNGVETASANFGASFIVPSIKMGTDIALDNGHALLPAVTLGYTGMHVDSYSETGSLANVSFNSRTIHQLNGRAELGFELEWTSDNKIDYQIVPFAGVEGRIASGDIDQVTATISGGSATFDPGGDRSMGAAFAGIKLNAIVTQTSVFDSSIETKIDNSGKLGVSGKWGVAFKF